MVSTSVFSPIFSPLFAKLRSERPAWHYHETPDDFKEQLRADFISCHQLVVIGAAAIPIRILAPFLNDKHEEPPLVVISPDGTNVIPLLGGHHGGNELACEIANILHGKAILTNSATQKHDPLGDIPHHWHVYPPKKMDMLRKQIVHHRKVNIISDCFYAHLPLSDRTKKPLEQQAEKILITDKLDKNARADLAIHPPTLTLGIGCIRNADPDAVIEFVEQTLIDHSIEKESIAAIASIDIKRHEPALHALAQKWQKPFRVFDANTLNITHKSYELAVNDVVYNAVGVHSVSEASAMAMASSLKIADARMILPKVAHSIATVAVASAAYPLHGDDISQKGQAVGMLHIIGIGPGDRNYLTIDSIKTLRHCDAIVGYSLYTALISSYIVGKDIYNFPLGKEILRVKKAIHLAENGYTVGLIGSGDAGIYAMASLVFELLAAREAKIAVAVHPGISAMVMASSRMGAILGHDFCAISLSDLLTKRDSILKRVEHAAQGDFVIAFYNPQSADRRSLLPQSVALLRQYRPPYTPVLIARNLTRNNESLKVVALKDFDTESVDMLSIVMVGNSESKSVHNIPLMPHAAFTPRGYG